MGASVGFRISTDSRLHLLEGSIHIVRDLFDLELLMDQLIFDLINPDV